MNAYRGNFAGGGIESDDLAGKFTQHGTSVVQAAVAEHCPVQMTFDPDTGWRANGPIERLQTMGKVDERARPFGETCAWQSISCNTPQRRLEHILHNEQFERPKLVGRGIVMPIAIRI